jgi:tetratricopeptide (TPR) repeat protein
MKNIFLLFIATGFFGSPHYSCAQQTQADSILLLIENHKAQDSAKVDLMNAYAVEMLEQGHEKAFQMGKESYELSKKINYKQGIAKACLTMGKISAAYKFEFDETMKSALEALKIGEEIKDKNIQSRANALMTECYPDNPNIRLGYNLKALTLAEEGGNDEYIGKALSTLAGDYVLQQNFGMAIKSLERATVYAKKTNDSKTLYFIYQNFGGAYMGMRKFEDALVKFKEAVFYARQVKNNRGLAFSLGQISDIYFMLKDTANGFNYIKQAIKIAEENHSNRNLVKHYYILKGVYKDLKNYEAALKYTDLFDSIENSIYKMDAVRNVEKLQGKFKKENEKLLATEEQIEEERKTYTQYAALGIGIVSLLILFLLLSRTIIVKPRVVRIFGIIGLLITFEFLNLLFHPFIEKITGHSPALMLLCLAGIASLMVPLHHWMEHWITTKMVEKNEKIRLAVARKIIEEAEIKQSKIS